jgi:hypothetical protein
VLVQSQLRLLTAFDFAVTKGLRGDVHIEAVALRPMVGCSAGRSESGEVETGFPYSATEKGGRRRGEREGLLSLA